MDFLELISAVEDAKSQLSTQFMCKLLQSEKAFTRFHRSRNQMVWFLFPLNILPIPTTSSSCQYNFLLCTQTYFLFFKEVVPTKPDPLECYQWYQKRASARKSRALQTFSKPRYKESTVVKVESMLLFAFWLIFIYFRYQRPSWSWLSHYF